MSDFSSKRQRPYDRMCNASFQAFVDNIRDDEGAMTPGNLAGLVLSLINDYYDGEDRDAQLVMLAAVVNALLDAEVNV